MIWALELMNYLIPKEVCNFSQVSKKLLLINSKTSKWIQMQIIFQPIKQTACLNTSKMLRIKSVQIKLFHRKISNFSCAGFSQHLGNCTNCWFIHQQDSYVTFNLVFFLLFFCKLFSLFLDIFLSFLLH